VTRGATAFDWTSRQLYHHGTNSPPYTCTAATQIACRRYQPLRPPADPARPRYISLRPDPTHRRTIWMSSGRDVRPPVIPVATLARISREAIRLMRPNAFDLTSERSKNDGGVPACACSSARSDRPILPRGSRRSDCPSVDEQAASS